MRFVIGVLVGVVITRLILNPKLQDVTAYMEKEKFLLDKIQEMEEELKRTVEYGRSF